MKAQFNKRHTIHLQPCHPGLSNFLTILILHPLLSFSAFLPDFHDFHTCCIFSCCRFEAFGNFSRYRIFSSTPRQSITSTRWPSRLRELRQISSTSPRSSSKLPRASLQRDDTVGIVSAARVGLYGVFFTPSRRPSLGACYCCRRQIHPDYSLAPLRLSQPCLLPWSWSARIGMRCLWHIAREGLDDLVIHHIKMDIKIGQHKGVEI